MTGHASRASEASELFGNYKAEWLGERIFEYFRTPTYFPDLERPRPCVLIGGRGTGKTTVLRCLSYEGRFALDSDPAKIPNWEYYGFYYRVNTNRVSAFKGPELPPERWQKLFGHYINLLLSQNVTKFLEWYAQHCPDAPALGEDLCLEVSRALNVEDATDLKSLRIAVRKGLSDFERLLNNIKAEQDLGLSLQGAPLDALFAGLREMPQFAGKSFFFLLDEYENLLDDQQVVVNSLLKHATVDYTFKIGVRELGWRRRYTLSDTEELTSPADYVRIDISVILTGDEFKEFARDVCDARLKNMLQPAASIIDLLPAATADAEAEALGASRVAKPIRERIRLSSDTRIARGADALSDLDVILIDLRGRLRGMTLEKALREQRTDSDEWHNFVDNYRYAALFQIAEAGSGITKLYCGWTTYTTMASANIRYLLELVDYAFREHQQADGTLGEKFSWQTQTKAAQAVGRKNLFELEGFREGALLVKLTIGLGRLFQIMARRPEGHSPEQNQFALSAVAPLSPQVESLLTNAVMHSALVRTIANKLNQTDARSYDYSLHPIFSAFFGISHRRKRKIIINPDDLMVIVKDPGRGVRQLLEREPEDVREPLPEQLRLFEAYLDDASQ
ncbi:hypothetical protein [Sphingomonas sp.]|jgi:hypothetical protein|uniref:ORC-CDC6 family AAA ATPase n=1 Tax=Sphingomonas sp. TaxID=28214 RepID=UPI002E3594F4|nr:hypothetical protein [Sphingomonas sp.]HEX4693556.1 hypothetical protein [Sphingomonas sp.]